MCISTERAVTETFGGALTTLTEDNINASRRGQGEIGVTQADSLSPGSVASDWSVPRPLLSWNHSLAYVYAVPTPCLQTGFAQAFLTAEVESRGRQVSVRFKLKIEFQTVEKANSWGSKIK